MASKPVVQNITQTTSSIPEYARPYYEGLMARAEGLSNEPYTPYKDQRIADFTPDQLKTQQDVMGLRTQGFQQGRNLSTQSGLAALDMAKNGFAPANISAQQIGFERVQGGTYTGPQMSAASTGYNPDLQNFQIGAPQQFGQQQAQQYMSPYFQSVVDTQKREAITDAQKSQLTANLGAARQGSYGGSRQLLATTERERALGQQLGDIQARGTQSAFESAQGQFERDRSAQLGVQGQNLQSMLSTQQLGANVGVQTSLANLSADQQSRVQNLASQLQAQGLTADQAIRAAMANQQAGITTATANQQADLEAQRASEQSRQFGFSSGLQALQQANQSGQTLSNIASTQQNSDLARLNAQSVVGQQQQGQAQQGLDTAYADFLRQRDYPVEQMGVLNNVIRGLPITPNSTATTYGQPPSTAAGLVGLGLSGLSATQLGRG